MAKKLNKYLFEYRGGEIVFGVTAPNREAARQAILKNDPKIKISLTYDGNALWPEMLECMAVYNDNRWEEIDDDFPTN